MAGLHVLAAVGINHIGALILPNAATAFGIFFLRQFFRTLPLEYEESARVDGARRLTVLGGSCCRWPPRRWPRWPR